MKKNIFFALALTTLASSSFAQLNTHLSKKATRIDLDSNDMSISLITDGKVIGTATIFPKCPPLAQCLPRKALKLALTLNGCLDKLGPVTSIAQFNERTHQYDLFVTATQIQNKRSLAARCVGPNVQTVNLEIPMGMDKDNANIILAKTMQNESQDPIYSPIPCTRDYRPVCGVRPRNCPPGRACTTVMPTPKTYVNACIMRAHGATLVSEGACPKKVTIQVPKKSFY